jgi:rare lipoprotein A
MKNCLIVLLSCVVLQACGANMRTSVKEPQGYSSVVQTESVGVYKVGNPYYVNGVLYTPHEDPNYNQTGVASWYGPKFHGRRTANGEVFDMYQMTAAHTTLPMPSQVKVTNLQNGKSIVVRVNDRGPFVDDRIIDMSYKAAQVLGFEEQGTTRVRVEYYSPAVGAAAKPEVTKLELEALEKERLARSRRAADEAARKKPVSEVSTVELAPPPAPPEPAPVVASALLVEPPVAVTPVAPPLVVVAAAPAAVIAPDPVNEEATQRTAVRREIHIQVGAFTNAKNAARMRDKVASFYDAHIRGAMVNDQQFFRVRLGPFSSKTEAGRIQNQLMDAGYLGARITVEKFM